MSEPAIPSNALLNYPFLLLTYMVCADQQIHSEEAKGLHGLARQTRMSSCTLEEMEKILSQHDDRLSIEAIAQKIPVHEQIEVMRQILAVAYVDGFCAPVERELVERIAGLWRISSTEIELLLEAAEGFAHQHKLVSHEQETCFGTRFLKDSETVLSHELLNQLATIAPHDSRFHQEQLQHETLFAGAEYDRAIEMCSRIAKEDYQFAETTFKSTSATLKILGQNLVQMSKSTRNKSQHKGQASSANEVAQQLDATIKALTSEIIANLEEIRQTLHAKQRALGDFSIAFMGKTKAGKSTLHAIIAGEGWDAIGVGKQRTTRCNRVYTWKKIRIIDTPGIGAPGGQTDEEIAKTVIDEADVICYVVTNDSIQETEFGFLKVLKDKTKPLMVLLNLKQNLRDTKRLEYFLKNPDKLFAMEGNSGIGGHIERIRRYAKEHYANDYFSIIPVMLLAAQMSRESEHQNRKDELFQVSRLQPFLDIIRLSLVEHGTIRRSQTLLGSTVGAIDLPHKWITHQLQIYKTLNETLKSKRKSLQDDIQKVRKDTSNSLRQKIKQVFQSVLQAIPSFAEEHWESNEIIMRLGWERKLQSIQFEEHLKTAYQEVMQDFDKEVQSALEEIGRELQFIAQLAGGDFTFKQQDSFHERLLFRIGGGILSVAAVFLMFTPLAPIGIVLGVLGGIASLVTGFFKSRDQKRREAVQKISVALSSQIEKYQQTTLQNAEAALSQHCRDVTVAVDQYFEELIQGLSGMTNQLEKAEKQLQQSSDYLNRAYAKRILDWCLEQTEPLTETVIDRAIVQVERDFGRSMVIHAKTDLPLKKSQDQIRAVLQEDIAIYLTQLVSKS
ncbi:50S ribosome-binding GTPase [Leptolyngbya sp. FACHB-321]|uniref:GTPase n=1 Tax=Leptolyngbya sp. FACHB-321 TaxID=2692807 RepID=UPI001688E586|nr:GTPase [Leptolyngbya sp. FACHB-321]MBD2033753.1 50S ribosome-binding GTPase [Leptolyngbya sp. FACHB-321]